MTPNQQVALANLSTAATHLRIHAQAGGISAESLERIAEHIAQQVAVVRDPGDCCKGVVR